ncbi:MAG: iron uptake porin [Synechococcaceae cyanobacterium]|nr:iron uptake porin [Synechococcaceae cyanobacterium]
MSAQPRALPPDSRAAASPPPALFPEVRLEEVDRQRPAAPASGPRPAASSPPAEPCPEGQDDCLTTAVMTGVSPQPPAEVETEADCQPSPWDGAPDPTACSGGQVANLKKFVDQYEFNYSTFSATTVLRGEAIFGIETINNLTRIDGKKSNGKTFYAGYRLRLNLDTSFFGKDRLRIRLQSRTLPELESITGSPLTNLSFDGDTLGRIEFSDIWYRFPLGKNTEVNISAIGASLRDNVPVVNPLFYGSSAGSISVFGSEDPIVRSGSGIALGVSHDLTRDLNLSAAFISRTAENGARGKGVLGDRYGSILQLTYKPHKGFTAALSLTHSLNDGFLRDQFDSSNNVRGTALSGEIYYLIKKWFAFGMRGGLIEASATDIRRTPRKRIGSYGFTIGFPDLLGRGNLLGFVLGQPPDIVNDSLAAVDSIAPTHLEAFYRITLTDQISITPGVMYISVPGETRRLREVPYWIGALRLTFRF